MGDGRHRWVNVCVSLSQDTYQRTPLHSCAIGGTVETLQVLISCECDMAAVDGEQHNAVHWATGENYKKLF